MAMNFEKLKKYDKENMIELFENFPVQCEEALEIAENFKGPLGLGVRQFDNIIVLGMGGSGISGHLMKDLLKKELKIPVFVNQTYELPGFANKNSLVFAVSYSGNTEEIIACFKSAKEIDCKIIAITSNGKLARMHRKCILIPSGIPPRVALGHLLIPMLVILHKAELIKSKNSDIAEAVRILRGKQKEIKSAGMKIAEALKGKIPVVYASAGFESVALRWRTQFNENSKTFSHSNTFPELNHNESVGWGPFEEKLVFILLRDMEEGVQVGKRISATKKLLKEKSVVIEINSAGQSLLARALYLISVGDFASYYLALLNGVDPTPVKNIEYLKKAIEETGSEK